MTHISVKVDGTTYEDDVEPRLLPVHYQRDRLGPAGTEYAVTVPGRDRGGAGGRPPGPRTVRPPARDGRGPGGGPAVVEGAECA